MDRIITLLNKLHWYEEPHLVVKGTIDRPVYSHETKLKTYKVIVGPLWTTHYDIRKDCIGEIDSIKTEDYEGVESKILQLSEIR